MQCLIEDIIISILFLIENKNILFMKKQFKEIIIKLLSFKLLNYHLLNYYLHDFSSNLKTF